VDESVALQLAYHISTARLGRRRLAARTGLSEMAVRIELERMRDRGFVRLLRSGVELTAAGVRRFAPLLEPIRSVVRIELTSLRLGDVALAAHIAGRAAPPVWMLRDDAVRKGATGLLLLRFRTDGWCFAHDAEPVDRGNPKDAAKIGSAFPDPSDGDLLPIAFGPSVKDAGLGLWRAVHALLAHAR